MQQQQHFLIVTVAVQGHINPARQLARRLPRIVSARVTISTGLSAHRKLFGTGDQVEDDNDESGVLISYFPYSDEVDEAKSGGNDFFARLKLVGSESLSSVIATLSAAARPVTCVIYTILLSWAADVGRAFGIPSVPFWVQSATVFAVIHRYFHDASDLVSAPLELPGLPPLRVEDLPSFLVQNMLNGSVSSSVLIDAFEEMLRTIDRDAPTVLVNTFDSLEPGVLASGTVGSLKLVAVGPMASKSALRRDLFEDDRGTRYMEWLDSKQERSVVYVAFGSLAALPKEQMEGIARGLKESGRPYLWVVRKDAKEQEVGDLGEEGLAVEWCDQVGVLSHRSVGCFVTHCGWNSTTESLSCGVPMVSLPQWADQPTNARMVEGAWRSGVTMTATTATAKAAELVRCLDVVMGEGGEEIRSRAATWREEAAGALEEGCGSSYRNLKAFVEAIGSSADPPLGGRKSGPDPFADPIIEFGASVTL